MEFTTIGESCTLHARIGWQGLTKSEFLDEGDYYLVTGVDFDNGHIAFDSCHFVTKERYDQDPHIQLKQSDVLVTKDGTIGKVAYIDKPIDRPATLNSGVFVVRPKDTTLLLPEYLMIMLMSDHFCRFIEQIKVGCTIAHLNQEKFLHYRFPLPLVAEQRHIIEVYYVATEIINKHQRQLCTLDQLIKARFVEMFGLYPDNPMGWRTGVIRDVVSDVRYGSSRPAVESGRYPYLRMNNITYSGELDLTDTKRIDVPENELDKCTVRRGDVLFNRTNSKELVGKTCVYNRDEMMVLAGFVIRIRLKDTMLPEFLSAFLNTDFSKQMLLGMCKTAIGQANINAQEMQGIGLYIPPIELQQEYVSFKAQVDKSKVVVQEALEKAQLLFDSLMQQYFG